MATGAPAPQVNPHHEAPNMLVPYTAIGTVVSFAALMLPPPPLAIIDPELWDGGITVVFITCLAYTVWALWNANRLLADRNRQLHDKLQDELRAHLERTHEHAMRLGELESQVKRSGENAGQ